ncbi:MAG: cysteine desulfurase family protein [Pacificimonas sp.]
MSIYLDYQATTPVDPVVLGAMQPYWDSNFANPHSEHRQGWQAAAAVDIARGQVADVADVSPDWVVFTSGATEANNLALKGVMQAAAPERNRLITAATEHSCVLESAYWLEKQGFALTVLPVQADGLLDPAVVEAALDEDVALISVMAVNNEIGVIQPLTAIGELAKRAGALFHSDAAQGFGKIPLNIEAMQIDLLSVSGHKIYAPKGVGALIRNPEIALTPQMHGGGQEADGLRSGTLAPALIAGLGKASVVALEQMDADQRKATAQMRIMMSLLPQPYEINGSKEARWPGNLNMTFPGIDGARLISDLRRLSISSGAACASAAGRSSHVLAALGMSKAEAAATLRMGWGRFTTDMEIREAGKMIADAVAVQRS